MAVVPGRDDGVAAEVRYLLVPSAAAMTLGWPARHNEVGRDAGRAREHKEIA
jgi:hypothetical protein